MAKKTKTRLSSESALFLLVLGAIVVLVNLLGVFVHLRADATDKKLFSLAAGSRAVASKLEDQLEIRAYFTEKLPPPFNAIERYTRDLLAEYRDASGGKITMRIINPESDEEKQAAERDGIQRVQDQAFNMEGDGIELKEGFRGISFHYLGDSEAIARVDTTAGLEYEITQKIKELVGDKTAIGVLGGHEGPTLAEGLANLRSYLPTYDLREVKADKAIDKDIKALLVVHPETALTEVELRHIDKYVMEGGSLAVFGGAIKIEEGQGQPSGAPIDTGLNKLLEKWGVKLDNRIVADAQCSRARMPTQIPGLVVPVPYPPVPLVTFDEEQREHPTLFRLDQVHMPYPVRVALDDTLKGDKEVERTVLMRSTDKAWLMEGDSIDLKARERWNVPGYNGPYVMAVALRGKLPSAFAAAASTEPADEAAAQIEAPARAESEARVLVFGTGLFMHDQFLPKPQPGRPFMSSAVAFTLNSIDWLTQDSDLIEIRAKNVEEPMLAVPLNVKEAESTIREAMEEQDEAKAEQAFEERKEAMKAWDARKSAYRWGNTLAIPGVFALFGIVRWRVRRARKASLTL